MSRKKHLLSDNPPNPIPNVAPKRTRKVRGSYLTEAERFKKRESDLKRLQSLNKAQQQLLHADKMDAKLLSTSSPEMKATVGAQGTKQPQGSLFHRNCSFLDPAPFL
jgi:hypothetical protein